MNSFSGLVLNQMNSPIANNDNTMNSPALTEVKQKKCGNCGEFGHNKRKCPHSPKINSSEDVEKESTRKCGKCGQVGHNARTCPTVVQHDMEDPDATTRLEFGKKFWTVDLKDDTTMVTFGKIGTYGRKEAPKKHSSVEESMEWASTMIDKKLNKGYLVTDYSDDEDGTVEPVEYHHPSPNGIDEKLEEGMAPTVEVCKSVVVEEIEGTIFSFRDDGDNVETKIQWSTE